MTALQDIRIFPYLTPNPLKENSFLEESWISWFPNYKTGDSADGLPSFFHEENIAYFEKIENFVSQQFRTALQRMWPLFEGIYIEQIQISIDFLISTNPHTLASYIPQKSNPAMGKYISLKKTFGSMNWSTFLITGKLSMRKLLQIQTILRMHLPITS